MVLRCIPPRQAVSGWSFGQPLHGRESRRTAFISEDEGGGVYPFDVPSHKPPEFGWVGCVVPRNVCLDPPTFQHPSGGPSTKHRTQDASTAGITTFKQSVNPRQQCCRVNSAVAGQSQCNGRILRDYRKRRSESVASSIVSGQKCHIHRATQANTVTTRTSTLTTPLLTFC